VHRLAAASGHVAWADAEGVEQMQVSGGGRARVATVAGEVLGLVQDDVGLAWLERAQGASSGTVKALGPTGARVVVGDAPLASGLCGRGASLYYASDQKIWRVGR